MSFRRLSSLENSSIAVDRAVDSKYDKVKIVADNIDAVVSAADGVPATLKYLGASSTRPTLRIDGSPMEDGDYYLDTSGQTGVIFYHSSGSWSHIDAESSLASSVSAEANAAQSALDAAATASDRAQVAADLLVIPSLELAVAENTAKVSNVDHPAVNEIVPPGAIFTDTTYTSSDFDHDSLVNHSPDQHRVINDSGTSATELYSASEITARLALKSDTHSHPYLGTLDKAADSELLDGLDSSAFAQKGVSETVTGDWNFDGLTTSFQFRVHWTNNLNSAYQRFSCVQESQESRLYCHGVNDSGFTSSFKQGWYDGVGYLNVTAAAGVIEFLSIVSAQGLVLTGLPTYADEASAVVGGLSTDSVYKTATGELRIKL